MDRSAQIPATRGLAKAGPFGVLGLRRYGLVLALALLPVLAGLTAVPVLAQDSPATEVGEMRLNTTGRTIQLPVPLKDGPDDLGDIVLRIDPGDAVSIPKRKLSELLAKTLGEEAIARLNEVGGDQSEVSIAELKAAGFNVSFDTNLLVLVFEPDFEQRGVKELSMGGHRQRSTSSVAAAPASVSGYLNILGGVDHIWDTDPNGAVNSGRENTGMRFDLQGVLRAGGLVLENDAVYEGAVDFTSCPTDAVCVYRHQEGIKRRATRIVYDRPEDRVRVQVGDTDTLATSIQNSPSVLGVSVEKSNRKLAPGENVRPTGSRSFQIVRPSDVDVVVNGSVLRRFSLRPGSYNLRDLPLGVGANEVDLVITDDTGSQQTVSFTQFFDHNLLAQGQSEWAVAAGVPSALVDGARSYRDGDYFGTAFIRSGLTDEVTGEAHFQADASVQMGGAGLFLATPWGAFGFEPAISYSDRGVGFATTASWSLSGFEGPASHYTGQRDSAYVTATYQGDDFRTPGEYLLTADGILYPQYPYWLRLTANYVTSIAPGVAATVSGRYQFAAEDPVIVTPFTVNSDRYGLDLSLSTSLGGAASASVTVGYSNEFLLRHPTVDTDGDRGEFRVAARVYLRPDDATRISTAYDTLNDTITMSAQRDEGRGVGRWATSVDVYRSGYDERGSASGTVSYFGNRADVQVAHRAGSEGLGWNQFRPTITEQRTSLRAGTAIAFADGHFAIGAPIKGDAFAIVEPHPSLAGKRVDVLSGDVVSAHTDGWGPALVSRIPVYTDHTIPIDVEDLPIGYSLGSGAFDLDAPYQSGHVLEVGSDFSVTVYGVLAGANGDPIALISGEAYQASNPDRRIPFFTNAAGKFAAEGLAPGDWVFEAATEGQATRFELRVPDGTDGLVRAGTLKPAGAI